MRPSVLRPLAAFVVALPLLVPVAALAQEGASVVFSEADYQAWMKLEFEDALRKSRTDYDRANKAKHEEAFRAAVKASGLSDEKREAIEMAIGEIDNLLNMLENQEISKADFDEAIAAYKPATVATIRKHLAEIRGDHGRQRADEQARAEVKEAAKGALVKASDIQGTWVVDADASIRAILGGMADSPEMAKAKADLEKSLGGNSYEFKGDRVIATAMQDGRPNVSKGMFRVEGRQIVFLHDGSKRERSLDIGMKDGRLVLGKGFSAAHYKRK